MAQGATIIAAADRRTIRVTGPATITLFGSGWRRELLGAAW
jgi:hypothetical protein